MITEWILPCLSAFAGTLGFGLLIRAPRRSLLPGSLIGAGIFTLYIAMNRLGVADPAAFFLCSLMGSILALCCAAKMKMIGTIFLMLSIVSFVPGLGLYRSMRFLGAGLTSAGVDQGIGAMVTILMIALGQGTGSLVFRAFRAGQAALRSQRHSSRPR